MRRFLAIAGVCLLLFMIATNPTGTADMFRAIFGWIGMMAHGFAKFFTRLVH